MIFNELLIIICGTERVSLLCSLRQIERKAVSPDSAAFSLLHTGRFPLGERSGGLP